MKHWIDEVNMTEEEINLFDEIADRLSKVRAGANIWGGGRWSPDTDLNWAFQQIRPNGKPAGDNPKHNQKAAEMLQTWVPSLSPQDAGTLISEIHHLSAQLINSMQKRIGELNARSYVFGMKETINAGY